MISRRELEELGQRKESSGSPVLSVYLDVDQSRAANLNRGFEAALRTTLREIENGLNGDEPGHFGEDSGRVLDFVKARKFCGRSVAIFCDESENFFWHRELQVRFLTRARWGAVPYVRPLWEACDEFERYGVILTDKAQARVFTVFLREIQEHGEALAEAEVRHIRAPGSNHRLSQMNIQRKAEEHARWHLKNVAELMESLAQRYEFDRLVLAGPGEATGELFGVLSKRMRARVVGTLALSVDADSRTILQETLALEESVERQGEEKLVDELITAAAKNARAVTGLDRTLRAAREARVWRFVYARGVKSAGARCDNCELLFDGSQSECSYCGKALAKVNDLVNRLVKQVISHGGRAEEVRRDAASKLESVGGVGAFLRF